MKLSDCHRLQRVSPLGLRWIVGFVAAVVAAVSLSALGGPPTTQPLPRIAFLGIWDRSAPLVEKAMRQTGISAAVLRDDQIVSVQPGSLDSLRGIDVLLVLNLRAETMPALRIKLAAARQVNPGLKIIPLDQRGVHAALSAAGLLDPDKHVPAYWLPNGAGNMGRLLVYVDKTYLGGSGAVEPPMPVPDSGFYIPGQPDRAAEDLHALKAAIPWKEGAPTIALLIQQSFWITQDLKVVDAEAAALSARGFNVAVTFAQTAPEMESLLSDLHPDLLAEDRHGTLWSDPHGGKTFLQQLDAPYLRPVSMLAYTNDQWLADPRGLHPRDVGGFIALQESKGTIEPIVVGGLKTGISGYTLHEPIPERVNHFADRAWSWATLRTKPNAQKHIAIIYYNSTLGKDDLMRGTPTGGYLDGSESFMRFLPALQQRGYTIENAPKTNAELIDRVRERGRNIGPWAQGELETLADQESSVLIPLETYLKWFNSKLSPANREAIVKYYGPPPGRLMVVSRNGQQCIVIPTLRMGNILLAPQPERGEKQDEQLLHSHDIPPPHNYLAFYWWLQEEFRADAVIHWGTHGSLELLPGKSTGLSQDDWTDICAGKMPIINLWIMGNLGEATISRRRSYALLVDHLCPPAVQTGLSREATVLHEDIEKFSSLQSGALQETYRKHISEAARDQRIDETLKLQVPAGKLLDDRQISAVHDYLHLLLESRTPASLHILGQNPDPRALPDYLTAILHKPFLDRVAAMLSADAKSAVNPAEKAVLVNARAQQVVRECILGDQPAPPSLEKDVAFGRDVLARLNQTSDETANLLRAMEGRYIAPGPGPEPIRNPASVPPGRNLYALNPEEIPTKAAWEVAVKLADEMLAAKKVHKVGIDLSGMSTMQDFGVTEAQILYLMGVKPIWDQNNLAIDVELIPADQLKRPRVDVFIAMGGSYKENFPSRVKLLDKAVHLAAAANDADNGVRAGSQALEAALLKKGFAAGRAHSLADARIFGTGNASIGGTNILYLAPRSGVWDTDDDIASVYIDHMSYVYTGDLWGEKIDGLYEQAIQGTDTLVRVWSSNLTSQLSNHHAYEYLGGMSLAVTKLTGHEPDAVIDDVRDPDGPRVRDFSEVLATDFRMQLLNTAWINGMKQHDYAGAGQIAELVKNTFGWQVTRRSSVSNGTWNDIYQTYIKDKNNLDLHAWFDRVNPHAQQEIAATMLEAARKGYWNASQDQLMGISQVYAASVAKFGVSDGLVTGGNMALQKFVTAHLSAPGDQPLARAFADAMTKASTPVPAAPGMTKVAGQALQQLTKPLTATGAPVSGVRLVSAHWLWGWGAGAAILAIFVLGIWRRTGSIG